MTIDLAILAPIYPPAPGGAANYTRILGANLVKSSQISNVHVYTEKHPERQSNDVIQHENFHFHDWFPFRAGQSRKGPMSYLWYIIQQVQFLLLPFWLPSSVNRLLVHSSLHLNPNLLSAGLSLLRRFRKTPIQMICDVRDPLITSKLHGQLEVYDTIVCCSLAIKEGLDTSENLARKTVQIPIIFEPTEADSALSRALIERHLPGKGRYAFSANGISKDKSLDLMIDIVRELRKANDISFVVAGRDRDWGPEYEAATKEGVLVYVGMQTHEEILAWVHGAAIHINISQIEGLPRGSLEAISAGTPVLLPPNIIEFNRHCPAYTLKSQNSAEAASQAQEIMNTLGACKGYPVSDHSVSNVVGQFISLFGQEESSVSS